MVPCVKAPSGIVSSAIPANLVPHVNENQGDIHAGTHAGKILHDIGCSAIPQVWLRLIEPSL